MAKIHPDIPKDQIMKLIEGLQTSDQLTLTDFFAGKRTHSATVALLTHAIYVRLILTEQAEHEKVKSRHSLREIVLLSEVLWMLTRHQHPYRL